MKLFPRLKIAQKLPIVVAGAALIASAVIGVGAYLIAANTVTAMTADKLVTVVEGRSRALEDRLAAIRTDLKATATSVGRKSIAVAPSPPAGSNTRVTRGTGPTPVSTLAPRIRLSGKGCFSSRRCRLRA